MDNFVNKFCPLSRASQRLVRRDLLREGYKPCGNVTPKRDRDDGVSRETSCGIARQR